MSTVNKDGTKIVLPRSGPDEFWQAIHRHFAGEDQRKWKYLAMLALRENAGWPLEQIGKVFDHPKGHVTRCLARIKRDLREHFRMSPSLLELTQDEAAEDEILAERPVTGADSDDACQTDDDPETTDAA